MKCRIPSVWPSSFLAGPGPRKGTKGIFYMCLLSSLKVLGVLRGLEGAKGLCLPGVEVPLVLHPSRDWDVSPEDRRTLVGRSGLRALPSHGPGRLGTSRPDGTGELAGPTEGAWRYGRSVLSGGKGPIGLGHSEGISLSGFGYREVTQGVLPVEGESFPELSGEGSPSARYTVRARPTKGRPGMVPDHGRLEVRSRRSVRDATDGLSAQDVPGRSTSVAEGPRERVSTFGPGHNRGNRANPSDPAEVRPQPTVRHLQDDRTYGRALGAGGTVTTPESEVPDTQAHDFSPGGIRALAAKIEKISTQVAHARSRGRINLVFKTSVKGAGQVHVEVSRGPSGAVSMSVRVQDQHIRDELLRASPQIRRTLVEGGVQLVRFDVKAEGHPPAREVQIGYDHPHRRGSSRRWRGSRGWTG